MNIYSISDLHLSFSKDKPMDCFGDTWKNHSDKIKKSWESVVSNDDIILLPGDLSWAMNLEEAELDLKFLINLPGRKIFIRGNHDYWWKSINKIRNKCYKNCFFIQNDSLVIDKFVFVGARGWMLPDDYFLSEQNKKIYKRELLRLEISLKSGAKKAKGKTIIAMLHYPPINKNFSCSNFSNLLEKYGVNICVYGHIHNDFNERLFLSGIFNNIKYYLVSCDYLKFNIKKII